MSLRQAYKFVNMFEPNTHITVSVLLKSLYFFAENALRYGKRNIFCSLVGLTQAGAASLQPAVPSFPQMVFQVGDEPGDHRAGHAFAGAEHQLAPHGVERVGLDGDRAAAA